MGVGPFRSCYRSCGCDSYQDQRNRYPDMEDVNPDPYNFKIIQANQYGSYCIIVAEYPNCKNFEGKKVMVFKCDVEEILKRKKLDPHFELDKYSPVARFAPTDEGMRLALSLCKLYQLPMESFLKITDL